MRSLRTSAIIPALNEEATVADVVRAVCPSVDEVIVVDSGSSDDTAAVALAAGARVVCEPRPGKHWALHAGINASTGDELIFADADLQDPHPAMAAMLLAGLHTRPGIVLSKGYYRKPSGTEVDAGGRLTELSARPLLALYFAALTNVRQPLAGEFAVRARDLNGVRLAPGFAVDLGILLHCSRIGEVEQIDLGEKRHKHRSLADLGMASVQVANTILRAAGLELAQNSFAEYFDNRGDPRSVDLEALPPLELEERTSTAARASVRFPRALELLEPQEQSILRSIVEELLRLPELSCIFWGGSMPAQSKRRQWADVDLWAVFSGDPIEAKRTFINQTRDVAALRFIQQAGFLPWLGDMVSLNFFPGSTFSVDIGFCKLEDLCSANPGRQPAFIWGQPDNVREVQRRLRPQTYSRDPIDRVRIGLVNLLKVRKSLDRGHLWNAMECMTRARREWMGLHVKSRDPSDISYSRTDRDAESFLDPAEIHLLAGTAPKYDRHAIGEAAATLARAFRDEAVSLQDPRLTEEFQHLSSWLSGREGSAE